MRAPLLIYVSLVAICECIAQQTKEKELKTTLTEVTVFLDGAQLFETGSLTIPAEKSLLRIKGLSPYLDEKSIRVKGDGDFTILSVNHTFNFLNQLRKNRSLDSLNSLRESLESKVKLEESRLAVLREKISLLNENKALGGSSSGVSMTELKLAMDFYDTQLTAIKNEELRINNRITAWRDEQRKAEQQLKEQQDQKALPTSEIEIRVNAVRSVSAKFSVTYLVRNAGWFPKYDIRVKDVSTPLELIYKAEVFQHTGVDWRNVKLRFSNGMPNQTGQVPELQPWVMNFTRYTIRNNAAIYGSRAMSSSIIRGRVTDNSGAALPGVNVLVKGTTIGTTTDVNGSYSITLPNPGAELVFSYIGYSVNEVVPTNDEINVQLSPDVGQLNDVVVLGYGSKLSGRSPGIQIRGISSYKPESQPIITRFVENQTTVEIEVEDPYTILSEGDKLMVELVRYEIPAEYQYYAVPKLDKDAFLVAHVAQWDQYNLLEGEANLYFEDSYIGRSVLKAKSLTDTLSISLGRDKSIVIGRTKVDQYTQKRLIGGNKTETRGFTILVKNKKSYPVKINLYDQLPVSANNDITIKAIELSDAHHDNGTGKLTWHYTLDPQQQKEISLQYEVKYPKGESILLE